LQSHDDTLVKIERIRSVFQQAPLTLLVTVINAVLTAVVLVPVVSPRLLAIWLILIVMVSGLRWAVRQRFLSRARDGARCRPWAALSISGSLATGSLWGIGAPVLFPAADTYQLFFALVVGGMCAGTTSVNSAHLPTVLAYILPASLPLAGSFLAEGSTPRIVSALMILVFAAALSLTSLRAHRAFGERLRLQLALSRQGGELSNANERLRGEVAERQRAEATLHQAQKMEAIGHLTGGIAHDFNNLLQVMMGSLSMISRRAGGDPQILRYVQAAEQAAQQGAHLTSSLLAFARRESLREERVSVNTLLQEFQPILLRASGDTIRFQTFLAPELPRCDTDPGHFQSAILNLVINARDAMPEGGELSITTGVMTLGENDLLGNPDARPGRFVSVSVQDDGSGMTAEVLARVFEPFFTTKDVGKGTGLGLSQVYGFARQSGGHVHLRSKPGEGTCVTLCLPAADDGPPPCP
jgi:signal transduction histidine kinase